VLPGATQDIHTHTQDTCVLPPAAAVLLLQPDMPDSLAVNLTKAQAFSLHSRPSSPLKIYLDFDGHTATGTEATAANTQEHAVRYRGNSSKHTGACSQSAHVSLSYSGLSRKSSRGVCPRWRIAISQFAAAHCRCIMLLLHCWSWYVGVPFPQVQHGTMSAHCQPLSHLRLTQ